jgi:hypothetical protein
MGVGLLHSGRQTTHEQTKRRSKSLFAVLRRRLERGVVDFKLWWKTVSAVSVLILLKNFKGRRLAKVS